MIVNKAKKSLDSLLRERAYDEVKEFLENKGINIDDVEDEDIEALVEGKVKDMSNTLKGIAMGGAFFVVFETLFGL